MPARTLLAAALAVTLGLAGGCGTDPEVADPPGTGPASSLIPGGSLPPRTGPVPPTPPRTLAEVPNPVAVQGRAFDPATVEVAVGDTVTWANLDDEDHWILGEDPADIDSAPFEPGNSYAVTFDEPGTYPYTCNVHPDMAGTVVVRPRPAEVDEAAAAAAGSTARVPRT